MERRLFVKNLARAGISLWLIKPLSAIANIQHLSLVKRDTSDNLILPDAENSGEVIREIAVVDTVTIHQMEGCCSEVALRGYVAGLKESITRKGDRMGFITLKDLKGNIDVVVFPDLYEEASQCLKGGKLLLVKGRVDIGDSKTMLIASNIKTI